MWGSDKTTYGGKWHGVWHMDISHCSFSEWVCALQNSLQGLWDTVVLNITLLLVETDKELNCVFLGQRLSCLPVLHDLLSSLNIFCWKIFILLCLLWQKETAIHLIFESRDSPMWGQLERAVLFCLFSKKVLSYFKFASKEAEALVSTKEPSFSNDSC